jgi:hypothetical protein
VQLTDLHINKYTHPDILPDLLAFGGSVLAGVRPQVLLITGDLVDAKTKAEGSQQHPQEWQVCGCCLEAGREGGQEGWCCSGAGGGGLFNSLQVNS